ncbi:hypothetical protein Syun_011555 [Stephania yunnanensis]|uniref:Fungal lipase-type domain-containing protein n=1 Tax=Stephania yunnanensis TaxID=152371 RepID=A0AAP0JZZ2_9MAGN
MASFSSSEYVIYHPEKLGLSDLFSYFLFGRRLHGSELVELKTQETKLTGFNFITLITLILQKILLWLNKPLALLGRVVEFIFNLFSLNGGLFKLLLHLLTGKLVIPKRDSADFRSLIGHIDGRTDLQKPKPFLSFYEPNVEKTSLSVINMLDLTMMAAKVVYENEAFLKNVVTNHWKMNFVGFYNCWNEYVKGDETQAFIFTDRPLNAQLIVVSFRGTEPFAAKDWVTDLDLSWLSMGEEMGRVHLGFMKALGLQDDKDIKKGWPKTYVGTKRLAYYVIRDQVTALLKINPDAKIIVTGHSLGGALAVLFPSVLMLHQEESLLKSLYGVYTYGQPRVGDKTFGSYMSGQLNPVFRRYFRVVYRYDLVPRVPFDDKISQFSHFGGCLYYKSWFKGEVMKEEPAKNYFSLFYLPSKYFNAWLDLFRAFFIGFTQGKDYRESIASILFRLVGLIIPGLASHSPRDYVNGGRLAKITIGEEHEEEEAILV